MELLLALIPRREVSINLPELADGKEFRHNVTVQKELLIMVVVEVVVETLLFLFLAEVGEVSCTFVVVSGQRAMLACAQPKFLKRKWSL
ncbi:MAG: hypothetical protein JMM79_00230 [Candidatus Xiphinematobacter sp.]|nr:MAG: hypothetical protein JMM79_00230 [Candidatus Xiphinematobacter sp.]